MTSRNREMLAFVASWLDKMSVAGFAVGIYQEKTLGLLLGIVFLVFAIKFKARSLR